ncbi:hypothetical protein LBMAG56_24160 [Verrucomicrobiota bacterium]|nr:hypothetical protein LBMAG56_24160 [Verrucomicrobiota bacterium]
MPVLEPHAVASLQSLADSLRRELAFTKPGSDDGLLPLNYLLGELEELAAAQAFPAEFATALAAPRRCLDALLDRGGLFDPDSIALLKNWLAWLAEAVPAIVAAAPLPPFASASAPSPVSASAAAPAANAEAIAVIIPTEFATSTASAAPDSDDLLVLDPTLDPDLLREFLNESQEHLQQIELGVLALEKDPADNATLNAIFRAFHTFKGGSGFLHLTPLNRLAHELESLLDLARQSRLAITPAVIELILAGADATRQFLTALEQRLQIRPLTGEILLPLTALLSRVRAAANTASADPARRAVAPAGAASPPALAAVTPGPVSRAAVPPAPAAAAVAALGSQFLIKVETHKLDLVVDLVGELVIAQSLVAQETDPDAWDNTPLARHVTQLGRLTHELQKAALSLRMVSVRGTFWKMKRLVRDLAQKSGKAVELATVGEDTELDRSLVEELADPLVHMIRNSVDHGIELPDQRVAAGKPRHGTITLRAFHQGGSVVIEIRDDGAGLNRDRIRAKAIEKKLLAPDARPTDAELFNFIFAAGFTTAETVTDLSGRGVGMDVVRRNLEKLRGRIDIQSQPGRGTTFTITLPLTLAVIDGLVFSVGGQLFILPTLSFRESFRYDPALISHIHGYGEVVHCRGRLHPLVRLGEHFGHSAAPDLTRAIIIAVEADQQMCCFVIDQLARRHELVIKSLGELFRPNPAVCGAAILADGRVGLILDVNHLVKCRPAAPPLPLACAA